MESLQPPTLSRGAKTCGKFQVRTPRDPEGAACGLGEGLWIHRKKAGLSSIHYSEDQNRGLCILFHLLGLGSTGVGDAPASQN